MSMRIIRRIEDTVRNYPLLFLLTLFLFWCVFYLVFPAEYTRDILAPRGVTDRVIFGGNVVVSQEFIPHMGLSGITIPLGSETYPDSPLLLHVRATRDGADIVVVPIFSFHDQYAVFRFDPIWFPPEKAVWILEAPHAPPKSFWVYQEKDASIFTEGKAFQNHKMVRGNVGFTEIWNSPRFTAFRKSPSAPFLDIASWEYNSLVFGILVLIGYVVARRYTWNEKHIVLLCIGVGFVLHVWLALLTPVIIDEGSYIQDALQSSSDLLPFKDFLTKGPLYIFAIWLWSFIVPNTLIAWRLFSAIVWAVGGWFFWKLTIESELRPRARILSSTAFSMLPAVIALTTPLLLQTASASVVILGLVLAFRAVKKNSLQLAMYSGVVFTLAYFIRITAVVPATIAFLIYILLAKQGWKLKMALTYAGTGIVLFGLLFGLATATLGLSKAAVLTNMEAFLISQNRQELNTSDPASADGPIRALTIESRLFVRTSVWLLAPLALFPLLFVHKRNPVISTAIFVAMFFIGWNVLLTLVDTNFLLPKTLPTAIFLVLVVLFAIPFITSLAALLYTSEGAWKKYIGRWQIPTLIILWLVMTTLAYSKWGRFRQSYLTEFIPQLALLLGITFDYTFDTWKKIQPRWVYYLLITGVVFLTGVSVYQGFAIAHLYPHTGTIDQKSLVQVVRLIQKNIPTGDMIFTAQPVATALSNRKIIFGYSHPGWYREAYFGTISTELRDLLFKKPEEITEYLRNEAPFVLTESRTDEIYFDDYPERQAILNEKFVPIGSVPNETAGDTYTLYERR